MITGGIKFFSKNQVLEIDGGSITASSGDVVAESAIDKNPITSWISVGSDDSTTETLTLTFPSATIDRILLQNHNWREFTVEYWNGSSWTSFANVVGLDGSTSGISETDFADDTAYYEFDEVTTTQLRIQVVKTQTADEEKNIAQVIACQELGTLQGFPMVKRLRHSRNERKKTMLSGKVFIQKSIDSFECRIDFQDYPGSYSADIDLAMSLFDREDPFLMWLCGGRRGADYFSKAVRGFRLQDVYLMQVGKDVTIDYRSGGYKNPVNLSVDLEEHV